MSDSDIQIKEKRVWNILLLLTIVEGIAAEVALFLIERDVKNARFFGFSPSRLALIGIIFLLLIFFLFLLLNKTWRNKIISYVHTPSKPLEIIKWVGFFLIVILWFVIWTPASRLGTGEATFIRIQPFLVWLGLIGAQTYLFIKIAGNQLNSQVIIFQIKQNKKLILISGILVFLSGLIFYLLALLPSHFSNNQLYFPPGAPLSGLQVLLSWAFFAFLFILENKKDSGFFHSKIWTGVTFFVIWLVTNLFWISTPFTCTDDRPGPFPPNNLCYPQINDAIYSIGSHYITLGQGIYHQWVTDKPLYMVFLAIGQWIFGPTIDRYLLFQIIVLALIPPLLFLLGKRMMGYAGGLFLAALVITQEINSINLYAQIGSVNVKLENSELLTAFLLIILCLVLFNWYKSPGQKRWAVFSGGLLGLSILVRFNSILIAPIILIIFWIANRKNKKIILTGLCLFVLSFSLASMPGFLTERTATGNNYFIAKAQGILKSLNKTDTLSQNPKPTATPKVTPTPVKPGSNTTAKPGSSPSPNNSSNGLTYTPSTTNRGGSAGIFYHFLNNNYSSMAKLPIELFFEPITIQVDGNIWNFKVAEPIWKENLSFQNVIALLLSLVLVTLGIFTAGKKFGLAGLSPLVIQLGYYLGNAAAATSGGRYLEPVIWVTLIYFVLGIYTLTSLLVSLVRKDFQIKDIQSFNQPAAAPGPKYHENRNVVFLLIGFLLLGLLVPLSNSFPNRMPEQSGKQTNQTAYQLLSQNSSITASQWQSFLSDPKSAVVEGIAYHPRYYRSKFFLSGDPTFEMMVLGKQTVIVSYMVDVIPTAYFSDGSDVILVGCRLANDTMWSAKRTIIQTYALFQVDHEKNSYINGSSLPECSK